MNMASKDSVLSHELQYYPERGKIPFQIRNKRSAYFCDTILRMSNSVSDSDIMITICLENELPVNLILNTSADGIFSIHKKLIEYYGDTFGKMKLSDGDIVFDPPLSDYEYTCNINSIQKYKHTDELKCRLVKTSQPVIKKEKRRLISGCEKWLLNGHIITLRRLWSKGLSRNRYAALLD